ncbi:MAG: CapA family protein [Elusimicrobia bacterium]|nr:CapA family protein [Elusimicrobiota bacterium]
MKIPEANHQKTPTLFLRHLLNWYQKSKRNLPWRKSQDPYRVMVSEFMLVQTTAATVARRYEDFLKKFPTLKSLVNAPLWTVKNAWTGLGYNNRAVNLWNAARQIHAQGYFPQTPQELINLPGFGPYISAAVASIAFDAPAPLADVNVKRLLLRIFNSQDTGILEAFLSNPNVRPSIFNQTLMELGALICQAREPKCSLCPIRQFCITQGIHPLEPEPKAAQHLELFIRIIQDNTGRTLLAKRGPQEPFLKNTWGLPCETLPSCPAKKPGKTFRHSITHWRIHAHVQKIFTPKKISAKKSIYIAPEKLNKYLFSSLWWKALSCGAFLFLTGCASQKYVEQSPKSIPLQEQTVASTVKVEQAQTTRSTHVKSSPQNDAAAVTINAVGDVLLGSLTPAPAEIPPNNGRGLYDEVKPYLKGDIIFANLEGPVADGIIPAKCPKKKIKKGCFEFVMPTRLLPALVNAGFNVVSANNNHSLDAGAQGYASTIKALDAAGLKHAGKTNEIAWFSISGATIALAAFGFNSDKTFPSVLNIPAAQGLIKKLSAKADIVIVSFHGGAEGAQALRLPDAMEIFENEKRGHLRRFAHAVVDAGADMVIGHGPHVPRAMELYQGRLIAYSLGNFQTYGKMSLRGFNAYSALLKATINAKNGAFEEGQIVSFVQEEPGLPKFDPEHKAALLIQKLSKEDIAKNALQITNEGGLKINSQ